MPRRITKSILYIIDHLLSTFFLSECPLCNEISLGKRVCENCLVLEKIECLNIGADSLSFAMRSSAPIFRHSIFFINENVLRLFRLIKYCHEHALMNVFKEAFEKELINFKKVEIICPIPMSKKSWKERGFNTAEEIARWVSVKTGIPMEKNGFIKIKETVNQASLNKKERQKNLKGAYQWNPKIKTPNSLLIVDDICTTGATFEECIKTAAKANIQNISTFSLFQTPLYLSHSLNSL